MALGKKDFVEIEFTAKVKGGEVFDSNVKEELEKLHQGHDHPVETEPFTFCIGEGMFLPSIEEFLVGKSEGETYDIELPPEKAFGPRNAKLIQRIPLKVFRSQNINPIPGYAFNFDGRVGKVLASSGGRVIVDFNNPVAGKDVLYHIKVLRKVEDINEKAKALIIFLFRNEIRFEIKGKKIILELPDSLEGFAMAFKEKFKDLLDLNLEVKKLEVSAKKEAENDSKKDEENKPSEISEKDN